MNSHIDDIIGLIDSVLGPDDNSPVPTDSEMNGGGRFATAVQHIRRQPFVQPYTTPMGRTRSTSGKYRTNELDNLTLAKLEAHLGTRTERGLSNNTKVARDFQGNLVIILHQTAIVTYKRNVDGEVTMTLDSGGWRTTTTKQRMNAFLPNRYGIYADKGNWYIRVGSYPDADRLDYHDGINLYTGER
jgi:hypothetical protein